ncbi:hypothetical protein [Streptomyces qinglanensis]|uniref:hypothetical protein n=1 Tax=Streptomyces qinglanensis TaxID=943816 RepID=UPI003D739B14
MAEGASRSASSRSVQPQQHIHSVEGHIGRAEAGEVNGSSALVLGHLAGSTEPL